MQKVSRNTGYVKESSVCHRIAVVPIFLTVSVNLVDETNVRLLLFVGAQRAKVLWKSQSKLSLNEEFNG